jgi:hypothetical protein
MLLLSFPQSFPMLRHPFFHWCTFCTLNPCCDAQKSLQPATPGLGELPMVVKPKYPFCFPFCLVTAVIDGTRCIHFRDQCLRCAAPRIARYGVVWRWAEPSQGPACRPPILTLLWMTASIKCQPTQPHRHDTLEMAESA